MEENTNKAGKIVLLIFLLICSGLGIAAFTMSFKRCDKDGFKNGSPSKPVQLIINDSNIRNAVNMWVKDRNEAIKTYGPISTWDTSQVTDMSFLFYATSFNGDISNWDVSNVTNMAGMFQGATKFNNGGKPLKWNTSNVTSIDLMFYGAEKFNQDISNWDTSKITRLYKVFWGATSFNQDISKWNVKNVTTMNVMFYGATSFNKDISNWDVSNVTNMAGMFYGATQFNNGGKPLKWNTSNVNNMDYLFYNAISFNQNISNWNVSKVTKCDNFADKNSQFLKPTFTNCNPSPSSPA